MAIRTTYNRWALAEFIIVLFGLMAFVWMCCRAEPVKGRWRATTVFVTIVTLYVVTMLYDGLLYCYALETGMRIDLQEMMHFAMIAFSAGLYSCVIYRNRTVSVSYAIQNAMTAVEDVKKSLRETDEKYKSVEEALLSLQDVHKNIEEIIHKEVNAFMKSVPIMNDTKEKEVFTATTSNNIQRGRRKTPRL